MHHNWSMPMRTDCVEYESRRYATGDTVQKCNLDMAPEAPWRCPADCAKYVRRLNDAGWTYGTLVPPSSVQEPPGLGDGSAAALLDEAEEIINAVASTMLAEIGRKQPNEPKWKFWRRR
jgi:hypothetical protein